MSVQDRLPSSLAESSFGGARGGAGRRVGNLATGRPDPETGAPAEWKADDVLKLFELSVPAGS
jgi:hypothetical protein